MNQNLSLVPAGPAPGDWHQVVGHEPNSVYVLLSKDNISSDRRVIRGVMVLGESVTPVELGRLPIGRIERLANRPENIPAELSPLRRECGEEAEAFSERVAMYYRAFSSWSSSPNRAIAEHSKVPIRRVQYWVAEARKHGKLPPGQQGKIG